MNTWLNSFFTSLSRLTLSVSLPPSRTHTLSHPHPCTHSHTLARTRTPCSFAHPLLTRRRKRQRLIISCPLLLNKKKLFLEWIFFFSTFGSNSKRLGFSWSIGSCGGKCIWRIIPWYCTSIVLWSHAMVWYENDQLSEQMSLKWVTHYHQHLVRDF